MKAGWSWWPIVKRLLPLLGATLGYTAWTAWQARRLPPAQRPQYRARRLQRGCQILCRLMGITVQAPATALPEGRPGLLVANHFSGLDPIVLATCWPVAFVGKAELAHWPLIGWLCRTYGVLFVERERRTRSLCFIQQVQERLKAGVPVMVFPEGTTGTGDAVRPFKTGAFEAVATQETGWVLPVALCLQQVDGQSATSAMRRWYAWTEELSFLRHLLRWLGTRHLQVQVRTGVPIPTAGRNRKQLAQAAYEQVAKLYREMSTERVAAVANDRIFSGAAMKQNNPGAVSEDGPQASSAPFA